MTEIILHIGMNKTGSSALQVFFTRHRAALRARGLLYPEAGVMAGAEAHYEISSATGFAQPILRNRHTHATRQVLHAALHGEIAAVRPSRVVISSETFVMKQDPATVQAFLRPYPVRVLVYLRRHDLWWQSAYTQAVKTVVDPPWDSTYQSFLERQLVNAGQETEFQALLSRWGRVFGEENLIVRPFERRQMPDGIVADFFRAIGAEAVLQGLDTDPGEVNQALSPRALAVVDALNRSGLADRWRGALVAWVVHRSARRPAGPRQPLFDPATRRDLVLPHLDAYADIARTYLGRSDGRLFLDPLPDPEEPWTAPRQGYLPGIVTALAPLLRSRRMPPDPASPIPSTVASTGADPARQPGATSPARLPGATPEPEPGREPDPLTRLAMLHGTDKWGEHLYTPHYHRIFAGRRERVARVLEIGIGGYDNPHCGGLSLLMWRDYFPKAHITGFDIAPKALPAQDRITVLRGDQSDPEDLARLARDHGPFDIIIDDGSHRPEHVMASFEALFEHLTPDGIYAVEDTQTTHMPAFGGGWPGTAETCTLRYFQELAGALNHREIALAWPEVALPARAAEITEIRFLHNLIFVHRGDNTAPSNQGDMTGEPLVAAALEDMRTLVAARAETTSEDPVPLLRMLHVLALQAGSDALLAACPTDLPRRISAAPAAHLRSHAEVLWRAGQALVKAGAPGRARALFNRLAGRFPDNALFAGDALRVTPAADLAEAYGRFATRAFTADGPLPPLAPLQKLAEDLIDRGEPAAMRAARDLCTGVLDRVPERQGFRLLRARAHLALGAPREALADLTGNSGGHYGPGRVATLAMRAIDRLAVEAPPAEDRGA